MTAEIAIINRTAVTLAADSAMTLSGGGADKIYNSADKIFELSSKDPIGIMVYNTLNFMGVPIDIAIKKFRDSNKCTNVDSLQEVADSFFSFLLKDIGAQDEVQKQHVRNLCITPFNIIRKNFDKRIEEIILQNPRKPPKDFNPQNVFDEEVQRILIPLRKKNVAKGFEDVTLEQFEALYGSAIDEATAYCWHEGIPLNDDDRKLLRELGSLIFLKDFITPQHTGIVIAGFGQKDLFPKLLEFQLDGIVADRFKAKNGKSVVIDRLKTTAAIIPFAQHDMADRFLYGIDPDVEREIATYLENSLRQTGTSIINGLPRRSAAKKTDLTSKLEQAIEVAVKEFKTDGLNSIKDKNKKLIQDMVSFMPKQELSNFAESLVNITSMKRKVSAEPESVGGPIDVAVISRSDGFVWVRRKHYFDPSLNPRFFFRKYGMLIPSAVGENND